MIPPNPAVPKFNTVGDIKGLVATTFKGYKFEFVELIVPASIMNVN
jgi:hypothetical protein